MCFPSPTESPRHTSLATQILVTQEQPEEKLSRNMEASRASPSQTKSHNAVVIRKMALHNLATCQLTLRISYCFLNSARPPSTSCFPSLLPDSSWYKSDQRRFSLMLNTSTFMIFFFLIGEGEISSLGR